jgi:hypothetical protein
VVIFVLAGLLLARVKARTHEGSQIDVPAMAG